MQLLIYSIAQSLSTENLKISYCLARIFLGTKFFQVNIAFVTTTCNEIGEATKHSRLCDADFAKWVTKI